MPVTSTVTALSLPAADQLAADQFATGHFGTGQFAAGQSAAGQSAAGQSAAGQSAAGQSAVGDYLLAVASGGREPADLLVVAVEAGGGVVCDELLDACLGFAAVDVIAAAQLTGESGQLTKTMARVGDALIGVVFLGVGDRSAAALRGAGGELGRLIGPGEEVVTNAIADRPGDEADALDGADAIAAFAEGVLLGSYRFSRRSAAQDPAAQDSAAQDTAAKPSAVRLLVARSEHGAQAAIGRAAAIASAVALARDLSNTPSNTKDPQWLAGVAADVAAQAGLGIRVWAGEELAAAGFGGIVAVGAGSAKPPRLIELSHAPPGARRHVVLVGKGITFDSGGLSLKNNEGMKLMKTDMAGGAAVIGVMSALAQLGVGDRVTGLVAAAENMPSGSAFRPGDVLTQYGGRTVEVRNTDAEGRLVLADALAYADAELAPDQIVDIATLTGAARTALGRNHAALYASCDDLADALLAAGQASGDRLWRMPLADDYRGVLDSAIADLANISAGDDGAGSIAAALFLREFTGGRPWAHLDIAGPARSSADDGEVSAGATGFGTRVLLRWLAGAG
jgi:leucyl aminopeptidase